MYMLLLGHVRFLVACTMVDIESRLYEFERDDSRFSNLEGRNLYILCLW